MKSGLFCQSNLLISSIPNLIQPQGPVMIFRAMEIMVPAKARSVTQGHDPLYPNLIDEIAMLNPSVIFLLGKQVSQSI
ncbi:MAG: hypothetical protein AB2L20_17745 [Mangrovibacterium sp.]